MKETTRNCSLVSVSCYLERGRAAQEAMKKRRYPMRMKGVTESASKPILQKHPGD